MNHAVTATALEELEDDKKGVPKNLPPLNKGAKLLPWLERCIRVLQRMIRLNYKPLGYVVRVKLEVGLDDDGDIFPGKCYTANADSLCNFLMARHTYEDDSFDVDNELLFNHLDTTLKGNSMASSLKSFRKTKKDDRGS